MNTKHYAFGALGLLAAAAVLFFAGYMDLGASGALLATTLAAAKPRAFELGDFNEIPMIADDIIYQGAAVGVVAASGHAQPLANPNQFAGFAEETCNNAGGAAAAKRVKVRTQGLVKLAIGSLAITDYGAPVYATDDDTFTLSASNAVLVGYVHRFVETGVGIVRFDAPSYAKMAIDT
jgi:hypothetical protein